METSCIVGCKGDGLLLCKLIVDWTAWHTRMILFTARDYNISSRWPSSGVCALQSQGTIYTHWLVTHDAHAGGKVTGDKKKIK